MKKQYLNPIKYLMSITKGLHSENFKQKISEIDDDFSSSCTSEEDDLTESDDEVKLKEDSNVEKIKVETDYSENQKLKFKGDIYNFTICAIITDCAPPLHLTFAIQQCLIIFTI